MTDIDIGRLNWHTDTAAIVATGATYEQWCKAWQSFRDEIKREHEQASAAEVPGFHVRTVIDDTMGKLFALRNSITVPVPDGLAALIDDVEAAVERAMEVGYDPEATTQRVPSPMAARSYSEFLSVTGSECLGECSCGGLFISEPESK